MKIVFVHDHKFKKYGDSVFSNGAFPFSVWSRYLSIFEVMTVVGRDGGALEDGETGHTLSSTQGVNFKLFPSISNLRSLVFGDKFAEEKCSELVAEHDAVIARLPSRLGQLFINEAIKQKKPYAVEVVGCSWDAFWNYGNWKAKVFAPLATFEMKRAVFKSPFVLYVTEHFLQDRYPCFNGDSVSCSNVEIPPVPYWVLERRLKKINYNIGKITLGLIGNYSSKYKGIDVAIRSLALAGEEEFDWDFQVLGKGDSQQYMELAKSLGVESKVSFIGSLPSGQPVYDWLDSVDLYLQPSFQEGLPRALVEAMSRGCPVLASRVAGIPELLNSGEMFSAGDTKALAEKLKIVMQDKEYLGRLARENFYKAESYYKPDLDARRTAFWSRFRDYVNKM